MTSEERINQIVEYALRKGDEETIELYSLTSESLGRYKRKYKENNADFEVTKTLRRLQEVYTENELKAIAKGGRLVPGLERVPIVNFKGDCVTFAFFTDPHIGSVYFCEKYYDAFLKECEKEKIDFGACGGDLSHGMDSSKLDLIYELSHIGYDKQKEEIIRLLKKFEWPLYAIDGNHDRWYIKHGGAKIVKDVCEALPNAIFLGHDEGNIPLNGDIVIRLWHGEDGSSYAVSYRLQKIVESLTGGDKPHILCAGHTHKQGYFFQRHIHVISGGALSTQQAWMRRRRMANHAGFWIIKAWIDGHSVCKLSPTWYPFYN